MDIFSRLDEDGIRWITLQFMDIKGYIKEVTVKRNKIDEDSFARGVPKLDGSSIEGFTSIEESDLTLKPVINTYVKIPWRSGLARFISEVVEKDGKPYKKDGRIILRRALTAYDAEGFTPYIGIEMEFFVFNRVEIDMTTPYTGMSYRIYSDESPHNTTGYPRMYKKGYYPATPLDTLFNYRMKISDLLAEYFNCEVDAHHHEVATSGQVELDIRYSTPLSTADNVLNVKYVARNIADEMGYVVTFMPKPLYGDNGSGMHTHISIWRENINLFYDPDDGYAELSQLGRYFIGGLIEHGRSLAALVAPTVNSYKRLIPGYEAPVYLVWSKANRSAAIRVPMYLKRDYNKRIEFRPPDPSANPYIALAAILLAGLDGIKKKIDPGDPIDRNIYEMSIDELRRYNIKMLPRDLYEALNELKSDDTYLKPYFSSEFLDTYYDIKLKEYKSISEYPTTPELYYYFSL